MILSRRAFGLGLSSAAFLGACSQVREFDTNSPARIDARVDSTLAQLYAEYPNSTPLAEKSVGMLIMPLVTEAGLGLGGAYGRGALRVGGGTVDYYSLTKASGGLQIGAQQYAHVLFFMTTEALRTFRRSPGFAAGANIQFATPSDGETFGTESTTAFAPIIGFVFGQSGLKIGATLEGVKYTRIDPGAWSQRNADYAAQNRTYDYDSVSGPFDQPAEGAYQGDW